MGFGGVCVNLERYGGISSLLFESRLGRGGRLPWRPAEVVQGGLAALVVRLSAVFAGIVLGG